MGGITGAFFVALLGAIIFYCAYWKRHNLSPNNSQSCETDMIPGIVGVSPGQVNCSDIEVTSYEI